MRALLLLTLLAGCSRAPRNNAGPASPLAIPDPPPVTTGPDAAPSADQVVVHGKTVLMPAALGPQFGIMINLDRPTEFFRPTLEQAEHAHSRLDGFLQGRSARALAPDLHTRAQGYFNQWVGVVLQDGRRFLYGNYFCHAFDDIKQPISVDDGGDCFLQVTFDLQHDAFVGLQVNGEA